MKLKFDWDAAKAKANFKAHGVNFELAKMVLKMRSPSDAWMIAKTMGKTGSSSLEWLTEAFYCFVCTERDERTRIISVGRATKREQDCYFKQNNSTNVQ